VVIDGGAVNRQFGLAESPLEPMCAERAEGYTQQGGKRRQHQQGSGTAVDWALGCVGRILVGHIFPIEWI
jgi:hypothetical protein